VDQGTRWCKTHTFLAASAVKPLLATRLTQRRTHNPSQPRCPRQILYHKRRPPPCALSTPGPGQHVTPSDVRLGQAVPAAAPSPQVSYNLTTGAMWRRTLPGKRRREEEEEKEEGQTRGGTPSQGSAAADEVGGTGTAHAPRSSEGTVGRCDASATRARRPHRNTTPAEPPLAPATHSCQRRGPCRWRRGRRGRRGSWARCRRQSAWSSETGSCNDRTRGVVSVVAGVRRARQRAAESGGARLPRQRAVAFMLPPPTPRQPSMCPRGAPRAAARALRAPARRGGTAKTTRVTTQQRAAPARRPAPRAKPYIMVRTDVSKGS